MSRERPVEVYDKAKWHYEADNFGRDLDPEQGFVHTGLFLGWLVLHDLVDMDDLADARTEIEEVRARRRTGPKLLEWLDGVLMSTMLTSEGDAFTHAYFDFDRGAYLRDYHETLGIGLPSPYHVRDTWSNYDRLAPLIDRRCAAWREAGRPTSWKPPLTLSERFRSFWKNLTSPKVPPGPDRPDEES